MSREGVKYTAKKFTVRTILPGLERFSGQIFFATPTGDTEVRYNLSFPEVVYSL